MEEQISKLNKVRRSGKAVKIAGRIAFTIDIVAAVIVLVFGIIFLCSDGSFDDEIQKAIKEEKISFSIGNGIIKYSETDMKYVANLESSIPGLNVKFKDAPISFALGLYLLLIATLCVLASVPLFLISSAFGLISREESPFSDKVIRKVLISLIIITVIISLTAGLGMSVIAAFITWAVYAIMDYGRTLQMQYDETL